MPLDESEIQSRVGPQLTRLADTLDDLPGVADAPSLCEGWTVKHLVAHMTMAARYDGPAFMAELEAAGYDFEQLSQTVAGRDGLLQFERQKIGACSAHQPEQPSSDTARASTRADRPSAPNRPAERVRRRAARD